MKLIIIFLIVFLSGCATAGLPIIELETTTETEIEMEIINIVPEYHKLTAEQAKEIMDSGQSYILLDVRTDSEYAERHIEGAVLIPDCEIAARAESELPDKNALILIYCRSGRRSANVAYELVAMGYTNVYDFGGILDWGY